MLLLKDIRRDPERVKAGLRRRGYPHPEVVDEILSLDARRRKLQQERDRLLNESKQRAAEVGRAFQAGDRARGEQLRQEAATLKSRIKEVEAEMAEAEHQLNERLLDLPNLPHPSVPEGTSDADNEVVRRHETPIHSATPIPHWEVAEQLGIIDFERGAKITGTGFPLYRKAGARLQRALINFFLAEAAAAGFEEIWPPYLVNEDSARGTGQLPDKDDQMYYVCKDDLYLIPTAEVPVTNIYRGEILPADVLPLKLTAYSPCFRREAGSYGQEVRGLNRVHQFDKVEIVVISRPEASYDLLEEMVAHGERLLQKLELPYRVVALCAGDLGTAAAKTYDLEVFAAGQQRWLEVSSVSNFETFQAARMRLRYRPADGKPALVHTLNGSALALPRVVAALLENNFEGDRVRLPEALHPYYGEAYLE